MSTELDIDAIDHLIEDRIAARRAKDFAKADAIRAELDAMGLLIIDGKDEATGELWTSWEAREVDKAP